MGTLKCDCEGWLKSAEQIFAAQGFAATHGANYTGDPFKFCPWCQKKLQEVDFYDFKYESSESTACVACGSHAKDMHYPGCLYEEPEPEYPIQDFYS